MNQLFTSGNDTRRQWTINDHPVSKLGFVGFLSIKKILINCECGLFVSNFIDAYNASPFIVSDWMCFSCSVFLSSVLFRKIIDDAQQSTTTSLRLVDLHATHPALCKESPRGNIHHNGIKIHKEKKNNEKANLETLRC